MSAHAVRLEAVRRKTGGRVHLTPRVPKDGPVTTLCGQTLPDGSYVAFGGEADCANCIRRSKDQARISGAFFAQEEGGELLRLSLEQARARRRAEPHPPSPAHAAKDKPVVWPSAKPPPETIPDEMGELATRGFRPAGEGVWRSPQGVIVRMRRHGKTWRFAELVFEGSLVATRTEDGLRIRAGDVELTPTDDGYAVRITRK